MKVLLINWIYGEGSTGVIVQDIEDYLTEKQHEVFVAADIKKSEGNVFVYNCAVEKALYWRLLHFGWPRYSASNISVIKLMRFIRDFNPDIIHVHVLNNGSINLYSLLGKLAKGGYKTVITHHAEFYYTGSCGYSYKCMQYADNQCNECNSKAYSTGATHFGNPHRMWSLMYKAINSFSVNNLMFTAVSPWVKERSMLSPIVNRYSCEVVLNGIDTNVFHIKDSDKHIFDKLNIIQSKVALHVTADFNPTDRNNIKGGYYLVELAKKRPDLAFIVVAAYIDNAESLPSNVYIWGKASSREELSMLYCAADVTVLTSYRETFSMICAESPCCGTPVVGFFAGGPESISLQKYCRFVDYGDVTALSDAVSDVLSVDFDRHNISREAIGIYSKEAMTKGYLEVYKKLLNKEV